MKIIINDRGFQYLHHPSHWHPHEESVIALQSSAIGDYEDSIDRPGSSFLWIGDDHRLNREEVQELIQHLIHWTKTGKLE